MWSDHTADNVIWQIPSIQVDAHWQKVKWGKSYLQCVERAKSMTKNQTFMSGPSTWSLKTCHIPTVGMLRWKFLCFVYFFVCVLMWQALHGSLLLISLCKKKLIISLCLFQCIDLTLIMSHCWYLSLGSTSDRKEMWLKNINIERNDLCINKYDNIYSALLASNIHLKPQNMSYLNCW